MDENLENKLKNKQQQLVNFKKVTAININLKQ